MKNNITGQEILLSTSSSLAQRELCADKLLNNNPGSQCDKLQAACWNGLLKEWLPKTVKAGIRAEKLFLWKLSVANSFLSIELGEALMSVDYYYSLDPYLFLPSKNIN